MPPQVSGRGPPDVISFAFPRPFGSAPSLPRWAPTKPSHRRRQPSHFTGKIGIVARVLSQNIRGRRHSHSEVYTHINQRFRVCRRVTSHQHPRSARANPRREKTISAPNPFLRYQTSSKIRCTGTFIACRPGALSQAPINR